MDLNGAGTTISEQNITEIVDSELVFSRLSCGIKNYHGCSSNQLLERIAGHDNRQWVNIDALL